MEVTFHFGVNDILLFQVSSETIQKRNASYRYNALQVPQLSHNLPPTACITTKFRSSLTSPSLSRLQRSVRFQQMSLLS